MKIQVLMSYYNGNEFVQEQLESILNQLGDFDLEVLVRDDGSSLTKAVDSIHQNKKVSIISGENLGPKNSFIELLLQSDKDAAYFAFSDQDDYWEPEKIEVAIKALSKYSNIPALYISKTLLVDEKLNKLGLDNFEKGAFDFGRTLIKNNGIGCTMIFNQKLRNVVASKKFKDTNADLLHDHMLYMLCTGMGGKVVYDEQPHILYRQHGNNVVGNRTSLLSKLADNGLMNTKKIRSGWCKEIYVNYKELLTVENRMFLEKVLEYDTKISKRLDLCKNNLFVTRSFLEKWNLYLLILLGKF